VSFGATKWAKDAATGDATCATRRLDQEGSLYWLLAACKDASNSWPWALRSWRCHSLREPMQKIREQWKSARPAHPMSSDFAPVPSRTSTGSCRAFTQIGSG
jgi:hypothetical protein